MGWDYPIVRLRRRAQSPADANRTAVVFLERYQKPGYWFGSVGSMMGPERRFSAKTWEVVAPDANGLPDWTQGSQVFANPDWADPA